jgi:hypothetical protein
VWEGGTGEPMTSVDERFRREDIGGVMAQATDIGVAILIGLAASLQVALLGALGRGRGPSEGVWISLLGTVTGFAILSGLRAARGGPVLAPPFDRAGVLVLVALGTGGLLALAMRGSVPGFAVTGLLALPFLFGASVLGPRLGIGLYLASVIAGQLVGGVVLDHIGAFGAEARHVDVVRIAGVAALLAGVALIRGAH